MNGTVSYLTTALDRAYDYAQAAYGDDAAGWSHVTNVAYTFDTDGEQIVGLLHSIAADGKDDDLRFVASLDLPSSLVTAIRVLNGDGTTVAGRVQEVIGSGNRIALRVAVSDLCDRARRLRAGAGGPLIAADIHDGLVELAVALLRS